MRPGIVDAYLEDVAYDEIAELERHEESKQILDVRYTVHEGTDTPNTPSTEAFWGVSVEGDGPQTLDWKLKPGDWTAVVMNADVSLGIVADLAFGAAPASNVDSIARTALIVAMVLVVGGLLLLSYGLLRRP